VSVHMADVVPHASRRAGKRVDRGLVVTATAPCPEMGGFAKVCACGEGGGLRGWRVARVVGCAGLQGAGLQGADRGRVEACGAVGGRECVVD